MCEIDLFLGHSFFGLVWITDLLVLYPQLYQKNKQKSIQNKLEYFEINPSQNSSSHLTTHLPTLQDSFYLMVFVILEFEFELEQLLVLIVVRIIDHFVVHFIELLLEGTLELSLRKNWNWIDLFTSSAFNLTLFFEKIDNN